MLTRLKMTFEIISPMAMGGADQTGELRPSSIKGGLRFWYRSLFFNELEDESFIFGGDAQSLFSLQMDRPLKAEETWSSFYSKKYRSKVKNTGGFPFNGLEYLGYTFPLNERNIKGPVFIKEDQSFELTCVFKKKPDPKILNKIISSFWLLGHFGNLGSRSKRGFGSIALTDWFGEGPGSDNIEKELEKFPLLNDENSPANWVRRFQEKLQFSKPSKKIHHPHFGKDFRLVIGKDFKFDRKESSDKSESLACIAFMGEKLQAFRSKKDPGYSDVKNYLTGNKFINYTPDRSSFGLPLSFRFKNLRGEVTFNHKNKTRHASLLHMKPVLIGNRIYPLYLRLDGDVPGGDTGDKKNLGTIIEKKGLEQSPFRNNAMDEFMALLERSKI